jgi:hypothetical protein
VSESATGLLYDPDAVWVLLQEAIQEHAEAELADIAISLYGQLGEARAEISRLRASLRLSLRAMSAQVAALRQPPHVVGGLDGVHPVTSVELGDDRGQVVTYGSYRQVKSRRDLGRL